ncbi:MAG TPA: phosphatase PAP2 family protein [Anaerolineae bacterium]|nr:phosphatase PAP2 family protein [Anaerolineae bacterium]
MSEWFEWSLGLTRWLQSAGGAWQLVMMGLSRLIGLDFLLPVIYWCGHKGLGRYLLYLQGVSLGWGELLKWWGQGPRPYWLAPELQLSSSDSYGVPSGHTIAATVSYGGLASWWGRWWGWLLAVVVIALIGLSRIYLGAHFVHDVVGGLLVGGLIVAGGRWWLGLPLAVRARWRWRGAWGLPSLLLVAYVVVRYGRELDLGVAWWGYVAEAELEGMEGVVHGLGAMIGLGVGYYGEERWVGFTVKGRWQQKVGRVLVGLAGVGLLGAGLLALPREPVGVVWPSRLVLVMLISLWVAWGAPWVFGRLGLLLPAGEDEGGE